VSASGRAPTASPAVLAGVRAVRSAGRPGALAPLVPTMHGTAHAGTHSRVCGAYGAEQVASLKLPRRKLEDLYEQIVLEMIELREMDTARAILRQTQAMVQMKKEEPDRCEMNQLTRGFCGVRSTRSDKRSCGEP